MKEGLILIFAYLVGSIPFGMLIGKIKGIDIRRHGSGNIGATNVARVLGKKWGYLVFLLDSLKGFLPVVLTSLLYTSIYLKICVGIIAILGHIFPIYLKFKGGKGVATTFGVFFGLCPWVVVGGCTVWLIVFFLSRIVSVASLLSSFSLPIFYILFYKKVDIIFYVLLIVAIIILIRHRENIKRLIERKELKFEKR